MDHHTQRLSLYISERDAELSVAERARVCVCAQCGAGVYTLVLHE